jgi:hypothetical protein
MPVTRGKNLSKRWCVKLAELCAGTAGWIRIEYMAPIYETGKRLLPANGAAPQLEHL